MAWSFRRRVRVWQPRGARRLLPGGPPPGWSPPPPERSLARRTDGLLRLALEVVHVHGPTGPRRCPLASTRTWNGGGRGFAEVKKTKGKRNVSETPLGDGRTIWPGGPGTNSGEVTKRPPGRDEVPLHGSAPILRSRFFFPAPVRRRATSGRLARPGPAGRRWGRALHSSSPAGGAVAGPRHEACKPPFPVDFSLTAFPPIVASEARPPDA